MKDEIVHRLLRLNEDFYKDFAKPFAKSRASPQPGFDLLLEFLPETYESILDVGCGNGRFGHFLLHTGEAFNYTGIDFTEELLLLAQKRVSGDYYQRDISQAGYLSELGEFDLIVCLAVMQHIPGRSNRVAMLKEMQEHVANGGRMFLSNWQFLDSPRQRRKIRDWASIGLKKEDVETGDYLLTWQRDGQGLRYVCAIGVEETVHLAKAANLEIITQLRSDGKEGNLNLYTILAPLEEESV